MNEARALGGTTVPSSRVLQPNVSSLTSISTIMAKVKKEPQEPTRRSERVQVSKAITKSKQEVSTSDVFRTQLLTEKAAAKIAKPKKKRCPRQRKSCRLLNLPGELRNKIYSLAPIEGRS